MLLAPYTMDLNVWNALICMFVMLVQMDIKLVMEFVYQKMKPVLIELMTKKAGIGILNKMMAVNNTEVNGVKYAKLAML